jgi:hypothetical protein
MTEVEKAAMLTLVLFFRFGEVAVELISSKFNRNQITVFGLDKILLL